MGKLQFRRGSAADRPVLSVGEPSLDTDALKAWVGTGEGNKQLQFAPPSSALVLYAATSTYGGDTVVNGRTGLSVESGTTTSTTSNALIDSTASFTTALVGLSVYNSTDDTWAKVDAFVSSTQLTLSVDIMVSGEVYAVASSIDNNTDVFNEVPSGFLSNITIQISDGSFTDTVTWIGKTAGGDFILTIQGSTTGTTTVAAEVEQRQRIFLSNITFTDRIFQYSGADIDWTTCTVTSNRRGFILNLAPAVVANVFRSSSSVRFESDPGIYTNISSTVTTGYELSAATSALGGDDSNNGLVIAQGFATSTTTNKLVDTSGIFTEDNSLNKTVYNVTDDTWAKITAVDSTTQLSLSVDIMVSGNSYVTVAAKATIQNAWNIVPGSFNSATDIRVSDGIFREDVDVFGKTASGAFEITFIGTRVNTHTGTATSGANLAGNGSAGYGTLTHTGAGWGVNTHQDNFVEITSGTGSGQIRNVMSNTSTVATITGRWDTVPDGTSVYRFYTCETRITGADGGAETTPVREYCFNVDNGQKGIIFEHLKTDYAATGGASGIIKVGGGSKATYRYCRMQGSGFWGFLATGAAAGTIDTCVFLDSTIGDVRCETGASISDVKRCRSTGGTNRSMNASTLGSIFNLYETFIDATTCAAGGILCGNGGIIVTDAYLEVDNSPVHNVIIQENSNLFINGVFGARSTQVIKNAGGWGVLSSAGGIGLSVSGVTYSGNASGTYSPVTMIAGGNS